LMITNTAVQSPPAREREMTNEELESMKHLAFKNRRILIGALGFITVLIIVYYLFVRPNPARDGKKLASAYCACATKYNEAVAKTNAEFVSSFTSYNFKKKQDARNKIQELQNPTIAENSECNTKTQNRYSDIRNKYVSDQEQRAAFDMAFSARQTACSQADQSKLLASFTQIETAIATIRDPEPDIAKIKSDLIGKQIPGWSFRALAEIAQAKVSNTSRGSGRVEYTIDLHLIGLQLKDNHDAQILVTYIQNADAWNYDNARELYITFTNQAPANTWQNITPLQNCSYTIVDNGQKYWVQDGIYGPKYKAGGTDADIFYLKSTQILLMSREDRPVDLLFKYVPNN
jgi:hypothetical protein